MITKQGKKILSDLKQQNQSHSSTCVQESQNFWRPQDVWA